jgi:HlyD family secretion protein
VIAQLEPSLFQTQVEQARATVQRLQAEVDAARVRVQDTVAKLARARQLSEGQLISANDLETAEAEARQAQASLKAAEAQLVQGRASLRNTEVNLGHARIEAPIDGIVISRNVDVGQTVAASMSAPTLFVIAQDLRRMQVNASVDESDIGRIQPGQQVEFQVDAYPDVIFAGTVKQVRLEPVVEQNVVTYVTVIDVPNPDRKLKPGMTANVTIEIARADGVLRVPNAALAFRPAAETFAALGQEAPAARPAAPGANGAVPAGDLAARATNRPRGRDGVWVLREGTLSRVPVQTGIDDGTTTGVTGGGLQEGDHVVTAVALQAAAPSPGGSGSPLLPRRPGASRAQGSRAQGGTR